MSVTFEYCVLSGRGLCDGPIPRLREYYRARAPAPVIECDQVQ